MSKLSKNFKKIKYDLINFIEPNIYYCYQCGKCTAGCPLTNFYEYKPHQITELIKLDRIDSIFDSNSIYLCLSCEICSNRCPQEINIAAIMNYLRNKSLQIGKPRIPIMSKFYKLFLKTVGRFGRSYEPALFLGLNLISGKLFNDLDIAFSILKKGKIKFLPEFIKGRKKMAKIIKKHM